MPADFFLKFFKKGLDIPSEIVYYIPCRHARDDKDVAG